MGAPAVAREFDGIEARMRRFERTMARETQDSSRRRVQATRSETDERQKAYDKLSREVTSEQRRSEREEIASAKRAAREVERIEEYKMRVRIRSSEMAGRAAARSAQVEASAAARGARRTGHAIGGTLSTVGGAAGAAISLGGGLLLADAARKQMGAEKAAALLVNSSTVGGVAPAGASVGNILAQAGAVSKATGVDKGELIGAVQNYVAKSSDFSGGLANMNFFAKLSTSSGTRLEDITSAAGILRAQNKGLSATDMQQMLLDLSEQGKMGAVEISDLAHLAGGLGASRGMFAGSVTGNQRKLMALAQLTMTEGTGAEEAMIGVKDLAAEALQKRKGGRERVGLEQLGVKYTKGGQVESIEQLIEATLTGSKGNLGTIEKIFGSRGSRVFQRLAPVFNDAGGGQAGLAAVRKEMGPILGARGDMGQMEAQYAQVMTTPAKRIELEFNRVVQTLAEKLEPRLESFARDTLPKVAEHFAGIVEKGSDLVDWFASHPFEGLGAVIGAKVTADIAKAAIGDSIKRTLETGIGQKLAGGFAIASAAFTIAEVGMMAIDHLAAENVRQQRADVAGDMGSINAASELFGKVRAGTVTPADLKKAEQVRDGMGQQLSRLKEESTEQDYYDPATGLPMGKSGVSSESVRAYDNATDSVRMLDQAMKSATEALLRMQSAASNVQPPQSPISDRPM